MNTELPAPPVSFQRHNAVLEFPSYDQAQFPRLTFTLLSGHDIPELRPFRVVMAYEDNEARGRARQKLEEMLASSIATDALEVIQWPFDFLSDPESLDIATNDALRADLLVFATTSREMAPSAGEAWLSSCLAARACHDTALITIFGADEPCVISLERVPSAVYEVKLMPGAHPQLASVHPFAA